MLGIVKLCYYYNFEPILGQCLHDCIARITKDFGHASQVPSSKQWLQFASKAPGLGNKIAANSDSMDSYAKNAASRLSTHGYEKACRIADSTPFWELTASVCSCDGYLYAG